ncbi:GNAT family N-acetyltransferase [Pseudahrensia aquimaris]|uniref:GNAT family N-acetyltransferase n=1 Tax=Pseudahrensia aquimaris TaxID=744461 RepID=A0ABW3FEQ2_9HYPH
MRLLSFPRKSSEQAQLISQRLTLRRPRIDDYEQWAKLRRESAEFLKPFEPKWARTELAKTSYRARLAQQEADIVSGRGYHWFLFSIENGALLGGLSLTNIRRGIIESGTLGYWMGEAYAGQHFMREAVSTVSDYAFDTLGLHRLEAATVLNNVASQKLLSACGFQREGEARAYLKINGAWRDHVLFARVNPQDD